MPWKKKSQVLGPLPTTRETQTKLLAPGPNHPSGHWTSNWKISPTWQCFLNKFYKNKYLGQYWQECRLKSLLTGISDSQLSTVSLHMTHLTKYEDSLDYINSELPQWTWKQNNFWLQKFPLKNRDLHWSQISWLTLQSMSFKKNSHMSPYHSTKTTVQLPMLISS